MEPGEWPGRMLPMPIKGPTMCPLPSMGPIPIEGPIPCGMFIDDGGMLGPLFCIAWRSGILELRIMDADWCIAIVAWLANSGPMATAAESALDMGPLWPVGEELGKYCRVEEGFFPSML
jgi:hypothetical protein